MASVKGGVREFSRARSRGKIIHEPRKPVSQILIQSETLVGEVFCASCPRLGAGSVSCTRPFSLFAYAGMVIKAIIAHSRFILDEPPITMLLGRPLKQSCSKDGTVLTGRAIYKLSTLLIIPSLSLVLSMLQSNGVSLARSWNIKEHTERSFSSTLFFFRV